MKNLLEKRSRLTADLRALLEKPEGEGGDLSEAQAKRFDKLKTELETLEKRIERQAFIDEADRRAQGEQLTGTGDNRFDEECRNFSLLKAIAGASGIGVDWGRERELSGELARRFGRPAQGLYVPMQIFEKRVVTTAAPAAGPGSNLVATDFYGNQFIDILRSKLIVRRLGARVLNGLIGNVDIPKLKASGTAGWVAENSALSAADMQFTKASLTPKHCGALVEFSRNMIMQTSPDVERLARDDFAKILAVAVDKVGINGGGSNEPDGVLQTSGIGSVTLAGTEPTWAEILQHIEEVEIDDAEGTAWATTPSAVKLLRSTPKEVDGSSIAVSADYLMESAKTLAGYPLASSNVVPSTLGTGTDESALIFGNWSDLILGYWSAFDLLVNPYESTAYSKGNVQVRGMLTMDVAVRHAESFCASQFTTA